MRIIFLTHYFPPEVNAPASRTIEHCREWVRLGHDVTVVTCVPNHPRGEVYEGYSNKLIFKETIDGINVIRIWSFLAANVGKTKRILNYISYMLSVVLYSPWLPKADIVVSMSPQFFCGVAGYFVSRVKQTKWILEIRDLWPKSISELEAINSPKILRMLERIEKWAYREANSIVIVVDSFRNHITSLGIGENKIYTITNGVDLNVFVPQPVTSLLDQYPELRDKFVIGYFGTFGMAQGLKVVIDAAELLLNNTEIVFLLVGDGAEKARLNQLVKSKCLTNVVMLDQQEKHKMPTFWSIADISLVHLKKIELFRDALPSKVFEGMAMRKPTLLGLEGLCREMIKSADAGEVFEPENPKSMVKAINRLFYDRLNLQEKGNNARKYIEDHYDRKKLAVDYLNVIKATIIDTKNSEFIN